MHKRQVENRPHNDECSTVGRKKGLRLENILFRCLILIFVFNLQNFWRSSQLLSTDVRAARLLLQRCLTGAKLTKREKNTLKRAIHDVAVAVPIGIVMLVPVSFTSFVSVNVFVFIYFCLGLQLLLLF